MFTAVHPWWPGASRPDGLRYLSGARRASVCALAFFRTQNAKWSTISRASFLPSSTAHHRMRGSASCLRGFLDCFSPSTLVYCRSAIDSPWGLRLQKDFSPTFSALDFSLVAAVAISIDAFATPIFVTGLFYNSFVSDNIPVQLSLPGHARHLFRVAKNLEVV